MQFIFILKKYLCNIDHKKKKFRLRFKIHYYILGSILCRIKNINININSILFINGWLNKETKLNTKIIPKILY